MATKQVEPDVDPRREGEQPPRNRNRNKKVGAFLAAAAIGLGAVAFMLATRGEEDSTTPADESPAAAPGTATGPLFLDLETGEKTPLAENLAGGFNYAASPDGTKLAYGTCCSGADVMTVANVDGTDARTLSRPRVSTSTEPGGHPMAPSSSTKSGTVEATQRSPATSATCSSRIFPAGGGHSSPISG